MAGTTPRKRSRTGAKKTTRRVAKTGRAGTKAGRTAVGREREMSESGSRRAATTSGRVVGGGARKTGKKGKTVGNRATANTGGQTKGKSRR